MRLFRSLVLSLSLLLALGAGVGTAAAAAPVVHEFHHVIVTPLRPAHASTASTACATKTWIYRGGVQKSFNSGQIDAYAEVGFLVDATNHNVFCNAVDGSGWQRCNFGCTGTWGFIDLYGCDTLNGPCPTRWEHTQYNFTTFYGTATATFTTDQCSLFQTDSGVPAPGGGYWYTTSQVVGFNVFC